MKAWKFTVMSILLALALMVSMVLVSLAEALCAEAQRGYMSMEDYTKVRWFAESDGFEANENAAPFEDARLEIDALPGSEWNLSADFVKIRDNRLVPYRGQTEVTGWCEWSSDALAVAEHRVVMPEAEGVYALTGRFADDEGNVYSIEMVFNVSSSNVMEKVLPKSGATTVEAKVRELAAQCSAQNFKTQYEMALWMHDWLIYNATYDYSDDPDHDPAGVLLYGTGVCDSYSRAYSLLMDAIGIENRRVVSDSMDHAWNLVRLDGNWCYVDCTWDDPGTGGDEKHVYFGMNTALLCRDHVLEESQPAADSLANYYPLREGLPCYTTPEELDAALSPHVSAQETAIEVYYIGMESESRIFNDVKGWISKKGATYGIWKYSMSYGDYDLILKNIVYTQPSGPVEQPENHLPVPVDAPDFDLESANGHYLLKNYSNNGLLLIFGRTTCGNTQALLRGLSSSLSGLYDSGVEVLVPLDGLKTPQDVEGMEERYPGYHYAYGSNIFWNYLRAVGYNVPPEGITYPCVFVLNRDAKITYYSTNYVSNVQEVVDEARSVATGKPLPTPENHTDLTPMLNGSGNVNSIQNGKTIVSAVQAAAKRGMVLLVMSKNLDKSFMEYYESHYRLFAQLGISVVTSFSEISDDEKALYPHCNIVEYSSDDFWPLLYAANFTGSSAYYLTSMLVEKGGDILSFTNGSVLNPEHCLLYAARKLTYDASVPAGLKVVDAEAFSGTAFRRLDLANGSLREIAAGAFAGCKALEFVRIPETVTAIGDNAFTNKNTVILCVVGSAAHKYAARNGLQYICD